MNGTELEHLETSLAEARSELSPIRARLTLARVTQRCLAAVRDNPTMYAFALVGSGAFSELAALELSAPIRLGYRRKAVEIFRNSIKAQALPILVVSWANKIVDLFYDKYAREDRSRLRSILATASTALSNAAKLTHSSDERAALLAQRSAVLRTQAIMSHGRESKARSEEAVRSSTRAVEEAPKNGYARLELGQALWASARLAESDEDCFQMLQAAEGALLSARDEKEPLPYLVLSRFYRQSNRPALALDQFHKYEQLEGGRQRRLLAEAFVLGESAMLLWYGDYDKTIVAESLSYAYDILSKAIDAGYGTARNYAALAFVQAASGQTEAAEYTLRRLSPDSIQSWSDLINRAELAISDPDFSALGEAFAIGLDDATVWNALGTYASSFFKDDLLAIRLYRIARRLDPDNAVVLTNLARVHLRQGGPEDIILASEAIQRAASCADRTFVWWRSLREEISKKHAGMPRQMKDPPNDLGRRSDKKISFHDIQKRYRALVAAVERDGIDPQKRGYIIEEIIADLLRITFTAGDVEASHTFGGRQIDAAFTYRDIRHRVEVRWKADPLDQTELDRVRSILEQAEVRGIIISMSGFTEPAVDYARRLGRDRAVILVHGDEIEKVMAGSIRFESLLEWKLVQWRSTGDPFGQITAKKYELRKPPREALEISSGISL